MQDFFVFAILNEDNLKEETTVFGNCVRDSESGYLEIPSIIDSHVKRLSQHKGLFTKASAMVKRYGYAVTLSEQLIVEDTVQPQKIFITIDTQGTFPGISVLSKLCNEIAKAMNISLEQINFCLFRQSPKP